MTAEKVIIWKNGSIVGFILPNSRERFTFSENYKGDFWVCYQFKFALYTFYGDVVEILYEI